MFADLSMKSLPPTWLGSKGELLRTHIVRFTPDNGLHSTSRHGRNVPEPGSKTRLGCDWIVGAKAKVGQAIRPFLTRIRYP